VEKTKGRKHLTKIIVQKNSRLIGHNFVQVQKKWNLFRTTLVDLVKSESVDAKKSVETVENVDPIPTEPTQPKIEETIVSLDTVVDLPVSEPSVVDPVQLAPVEEPTVEVDLTTPTGYKKEVKLDIKPEDPTVDMQTIAENDILYVVGDIYVLKKLLTIGGILAANSSVDPTSLVEKTPNSEATKHEELIVIDETPRNKYWEFVKKVYTYLFRETKAKKKPLEYYQALLSNQNDCVGTSILSLEWIHFDH
jgi:hypothetical protein